MKKGAGELSQTPDDPYSYLSGYQSSLQSEALPGVIHPAQRMPKNVLYGLIYEQINGAPFCAPRANNLMTSFYRIHPSVATHSAFTPQTHPGLCSNFTDFSCPEPVRWQPPSLITADSTRHFVDSLETIAGAGSAATATGLAINTFNCNADMNAFSFYNADAHMLIIPEKGPLDILTEFGKVYLQQGEVFVLPRGLKISVFLPDGAARGWCVELYDLLSFQLPDLGPIGSQGLADSRSFLAPTAWYEDRKGEYTILAKFAGVIHQATVDYSPYDVVAWCGRYYPTKYNLLHFMAFTSGTWDHADPSLHTVLNCPLDARLGSSALDFVCFRGRWDVAENTFRPPYYHRNVASEFSAILKLESEYSGFQQGTSFLTPRMSAHGLSSNSHNKFRALDDGEANLPHRLSDDSIWIMVESVYPLVSTPLGREAKNRDANYRAFFQGVERSFTGPSSGSAAEK